MQRATSPIIGTLGMLFATTGLMLAQNAGSDPKPRLPSGVLGTQLIVWSHLQKPQPLSDLTEQQRRETSAATLPTQEQSSSPTFAGSILKDGGKDALNSNDTPCQLDDQQKLKQCGKE
jgi:hypothetical protein